MSSIHLWSHYGYPDLKTAGDDNLARPITTWEAWPYDERVACELDRSGDGDCGPFAPPVLQGSGGGDSQVQAKIKESDSKGHWTVSQFDELPQDDPDTIAAYLATGTDVWFSMDIGSPWLTVRGDTVADYTADQVEGGHAILLAGYRHTNGQRQFLVHNSWGPDWGDHGYAWISEKVLRQFIKRAYKVTVADTTTVAPPPPNDVNALTDDDCADTSLVDSVTGQCVPMCPDDSRPANGHCGSAAGAKAPQAPARPPPRVPVQRH